MHDTHTVTSEVENSVQVSYFKLLFVHVVEIEIYMQERTPENKIKKKNIGRLLVIRSIMQDSAFTCDRLIAHIIR